MAVIGDNSQASSMYDFGFHDPGKWSTGLARAQDVGEQIAPAYNLFASQGLLSPDEINRISLANDQGMLMKRRLMQKALKGKLARSLGSRAGGAADVMFANQVLAPELANYATRRSNLMATSLMQGRELGVSGMADMMKMYMGTEKDEDSNKSGWLDYALALGGIGASLI